jgi:hypothetical protein
MGLAEIIKKLIEPAVVKNATDYERVNLVFGDGSILFDVDAEDGLDRSSFYGFLGSTGDNFNLFSLACYLRRFGLPFGYDFWEIAEEYALYAEERFEREGRVVPAHEELVNPWLNLLPDDKAFKKTPENAIYLDFSVHFLLDILQLEYRFVE